MKKSYFLFVILFFVVFIFIGNVVYANTNDNNTRIWIDYPKNNEEIGKQLKIQGWVMSKFANTEVEVYLDQTKIDVQRLQRPDVINSVSEYGTLNENPTPGFYKITDISNLSYGLHKLTINVLKDNQKVLTDNITFNHVTPKTRINLDYPRGDTKYVKTNKLKVQGWVMSEATSNKIELYIDGIKKDIELDRVERADVIKAISGYGTIEENPTPGFYKEIDISDLSYGKHSIKLIVLDSDNVKLNELSRIFEIGVPKTWINIDYPKSTSYSNTMKLKVQGWVMSEAKNSKVNLYIDGVKKNIELDRVERADVIKAISGYGTIEENPTPGFYKEIDISDLAYGKHTIKIEALDSNDGKLFEKNREFEIRAPKTWINIDYPKNISYSNTMKLKVQGWVMSEAPNSTVKLFIDGNERNVELDRVERADVIKAVTGYGTIEENPTPGFYKEIDINDLSYGIHTIKIEVYSNNNKLFQKSSNFEVRAPKTAINIDYPTTTGNYKISNLLKVQGWVMSEAPNSTVELYIDGIKRNVELDRVERADVINAIGGHGTIEENPTPGFYKEIDIKDLTYGKHTLKIKAISGNQTLYEASRQFTIIKPLTKVYIQKPTNNQTIGIDNNIDGWVMSEEKNLYVKIFVNNTEVTNTINRVERPDVIKAISGYGTIVENPTPGFTTTYSFDGQKDGNYTITAKAYSSTSNDLVATTSVIAKLKKYKGVTWIDYPTISTLNSNNTISISGWSITTGKANVVKVFVDNKEVGTPTRITREDVLNAYASYNLEVNNTCGYQINASLKNFSDGKHTITVKMYDELNEIVSEKSKVIHLYKNVYQGIDVSAHNGAINWDAVANSGINFAIIRVGYHGWLYDRNVEDSYFKYNLDSAKKRGLKVGLYFFSQAKNASEGATEAQFVLDRLNDFKNEYGYKPKIEYPISFDTEWGNEDHTGRADGISNNDRTMAAQYFMNKILSNGYKSSVYASKSWFHDKLNMLMLNNYDQWLAHYTYDQNIRSDYTGRYQVWQYTSTGTLSGISGYVDKNVSYYNYS